jgi:hypothetical protein
MLLLKIAEGLEDAGAKNVIGDLEITRDAISAGREIDNEEAVWRITPILVAAEAKQGMIKENGHLYKKVSPPLGGCINQPRCDQGKWTKDQVRHKLDTSVPAKLALFARLKSTAKRLCGTLPHLGGRRNQPRYDQGKWTPVQEGKLTIKCFFIPEMTSH